MLDDTDVFTDELSLEEVSRSIRNVEAMVFFCEDSKGHLQHLLESLKGIKRDLEKQEHDRALAVLADIRNVLLSGPSRTPAK